MRYSQILPIVCLFWLLSALANANTVTSFQLDNGLKLLVKEDHRSPVFIAQVWYAVGASDEYLGVTGVSHILEHMMFKGTKKYAAGEFSKIIAKNGGQDNAFTSKDYTAYYQKMGKDKLEVALALEADRMQNLNLKEVDFKTERDVVIEERRLRIEDNPKAKIYEKLRAITFSNKGSYHYPVIGTMADLAKMPLQTLADWYKKYYAANNAVIVVVGDVEPQAVYALVKKYFSHLNNKATPNIKRLKAHPIIAQKASLSLKAELPYFVMSYPVPSLAVMAKDAYVLEVLSYILNGNDNARLNTALMIKQQLVSEISVHYSLYDKYHTNFIISFTPAKGVSIADIKQEIYTQIQQLKTELIDQKTLNNIQIQTKSSHIYEQDSISTQAYYLGALETIGLGHQIADEYVTGIQKVNAQNIQDISKKYFLESMVSEVELVPTK